MPSSPYFLDELLNNENKMRQFTICVPNLVKLRRVLTIQAI